MKILLNKNRYKSSSNKTSSINVELSGNRKLLPVDAMQGVINEMDVYNNERSACTNVRLSLAVNVVASNVLFNYITEIVKDEGSPNARFYNISGITKEDKDKVLAGKGLCFMKGSTGILPNLGDFKDYGLAFNAIRDTQLSSENIGYKYHCGYDIFNNHILRSKTFKAVCPLKPSLFLKEFNTIEDYLRDADGNNVKFYDDKLNQTDNRPTLNAHIYLDEEIMSYPESIQNNLIEENDWYGFKNLEKFPMYNGDTKVKYDFSKVINDKMSCDFVDMYPERDLFSFVPKFNPYRRRIEKNWNYCITYPSSSTTEGFEFLREETNSLKVMYFDDKTIGRAGIEVITFYSMSKHGLKEEEYVNIYSGDEVVIDMAKVVEVIDDFTFSVFKNGIELSRRWVSLDDYGDEVSGQTDSGDTVYYRFKDKSKRMIQRFTRDENAGDEENEVIEVTGEYYTSKRKYANVDDGCQDISFKRVINGTECDYYVRIFSKVPNWRFADKEPSNDAELVQKYQAKDYDFENHIGKLAFAKSIYNDDLAEIVYSDNINIDGLLDNLGRPVTDLYFTVIKNNAGYRQWYGKNEVKVDAGDDAVEYSHCFGKNTCAFRLSDACLADETLTNICTTNNVVSTNGDTVPNPGLNVERLRAGEEHPENNYLDWDEIEYNDVYSGGSKIYAGDVNFYGDLCCYYKYYATEEPIQSIEFRFNTAQRELNNYDIEGGIAPRQSFATSDYFKGYVWDEIQSDDYDGTHGDKNFKLEQYDEKGEDDIVNNCRYTNARKEGYCYFPHYKIPVRTFSSELNSAYPIFYRVRRIEKVESEEKKYRVFLMSNAQMQEGSTFTLFDNITRQTIACIVTKLMNMKVVEFFAEEELQLALRTAESGDTGTGTLEITNTVEPRRYKLFVRYEEEIPKYAVMNDDGTCRFYWREVKQNGFDTDTLVETYPFTNNALYIEKNLNIYVKRQDPQNKYNLWVPYFPYGTEGKVLNDYDLDIYYDEKEVKC